MLVLFDEIDSLIIGKMTYILRENLVRNRYNGRKILANGEKKMKIIEVDEELYQYIAAQTQSIGESASDILRRLLNLPAHATSKVDFFESDVSTENTKSAVHSEPVLTEKTTEVSQSKVEPVEPPKVVKKQSDEAINHIVDKVRALLNSAEFKEEPKAVVQFF